jgi:hypothetical protein
MRVVSLKLQASGSLEHRLAFPVSTWHVHVHVSRTPLDRRGFEEACCRSTPCVVRYLDRAQGNAQAGSFFTSQTHQASRCSARRPGIHCHDMRICETGPKTLIRTPSLQLPDPLLLTFLNLHMIRQWRCAILHKYATTGLFRSLRLQIGTLLRGVEDFSPQPAMSVW